MRRFRFVWIILVAVLFLSMVSSFAYAETVDLPKTGQKACYDTGGTEIPCANTGQDGEKRAGVAWPSARFTDNGDGTVTDNLTGLIWLKNANCTETVGGVDKSGGTITWENALTWTNNLKSGDCGLTDGSNAGDWRLPNVNELKSLVHWGQADPAGWLNTQGFTNVQSDSYWSSSTSASNTVFAWYVGMWGGVVGSHTKGYDNYVWPVRAGQTDGASNPTYPANIPKTGQTKCYNVSGQEITCTDTGQDGDKQAGVAWPSPRFTAGAGAEADCVTDNLTGLMWAKDGNLPVGTKKWQDALDYVAWLNTPVGSGGGGLCGYNDWRLPNVNELKSLVHWGQADTATWLISQGFTNVQSDGYWSSSTSAGSTGGAWYVSMWIGVVSDGSKDDVYYVWPVRAGQVDNLVNLFITKAGAGTVTSDPGEINYGSVRQDMFASGTVVTLTATADAGSYFWYWTQDCSSCGITNPCNITMNAHKQCTATFGDVPLRTLTVTKAGTGTGTVTAGANCTLNWVGNTGTCSVADGTAITLTATADGGSTFTGWSGGTGSAAGCNGAGACNFNIGADSGVTATFTLNQYTVTPSAEAGGSISPNTQQTVNHGSTIDFTITPNSGYVVASVGGTCGGSLSGSTYTTNPITQNCTVVANFMQLINGECGSANGMLTVTAPTTNLCSAGTSSAITTNAGNYTWTCSGQNGGSNANCSAPRGYTVTPNASAGGSITPNTAQIVEYSKTTDFTITANTGKVIDSVTGCDGFLSGNNYKTGAITADCTVSATFKDTPINQPDILVSTIDINYGQVTTNQTSGKTITIKNTGNANLLIGTITKTGNDFSIADDLCSGKSLSVNQICTIKANFTPQSVGNKNGTITIPSNAEANKTVNLKGEGVAESKPKIEVFPTQINYSKVKTDGTATATVTIKNTGTAQLTVTGVAQTGAHASKFSNNNTCGDIASGQTCQFKVTYTPGGAGTHEAVVEIESNDPNTSKYTLPVKGTTDDPTDIVINTETGGVEFKYVLTKDTANVGSNPTTTVTNFTVTKTVEFGISNVATGVTITIEFDTLPANPVILKQLANGTLKQIYPNNEVVGISNVQLNTTTKTLTFILQDNSEGDLDGTVGVIKDPLVLGGGTSLFQLTVSKSGSGSGSVTSNPAGINCGSTCSFDFTENTSVTLTATASSGSTFSGWSGACSGLSSTCTVTMNSAKSVTATFNQNSTPPPPPSCTYTIDPTSKNFTYQGGSGTIAVTKTIIECEPDSWTSTASDNWITVTSGSSGSGNGTVSYTVSTNSSTTTERTGTITIAGNTFTITQDKASGKIISVSPTSVNFGSVKTGVMVTKQVTITNLGTDTITIGSISVTGTDAGKFAVNNPCSTISAGSSCVVSVTYYASNPVSSQTGSSVKSSSTHTATMVITSNATNSPTVNVELTRVTNNNVNPQISVTPMQINQVLDPEFGNSTGLVVTNTGSGLLIVEQVMIQGRDKGEFSVRNLCTEGVEANQNCRILINTNFSSYDSKEVSISIISNATNNSKLEIPVRLTSMSQCSINLDKTSGTYPATASNGVVSVTMSNQECMWRADTDVNWITVDKSWRKGNGNVSFTVNANTTGKVRMGKIQIGGRIFTVIQANTTTSSASGQVMSNFSIFLDTSGSSFENYINALYANGLTTGCNQNPLMYCPSNTVTRETGAVFMIRGIEGNPVSNYCGSSSPFTDVDVNAVWSCGHIKRLMERGVTYGCNSPAPNQVGTMYCPNLEMTRWQMAVMIIRALYGEDFSYPTTPYFSDVDVTDAGFKYIQKLKEVGITKAEGMFYPHRNLSREEMSAFLGRAFLGME